MDRMGLQRRTWLAVVLALVVGALLVPRVADAVGSIVTIQGGGGTTKASVTNGKQLQVAEAPPSSFREFEQVATGTSCQPLATIPATKGFVVRSIAIEMITPASTGFPIASVYPNGSCSGHDVASITTRSAGGRVIPVEPGFAIAAGGHMSMKVGTVDALAAVYVFGYLVPSSDVPSTTPIAS
jgi:hypothetical protein